MPPGSDYGGNSRDGQTIEDLIYFFSLDSLRDLFTHF